MNKTRAFYQHLEKISHYDWNTYFNMVDQLMANELGYVQDEFYEMEK